MFLIYLFILAVLFFRERKNTKLYVEGAGKDLGRAWRGEYNQIHCMKSFFQLKIVLKSPQSWDGLVGKVLAVLARGPNSGASIHINVVAWPCNLSVGGGDRWALTPSGQPI